MEMYPAQFPDEGHPDPSRRAEDSVFDVIQDSDRPGFVNHEEQPDPETPEVDFPYRCRAWATSSWRSSASGSH